jgi:hypothetical protein
MDAPAGENKRSVPVGAFPEMTAGGKTYEPSAVTPVIVPETRKKPEGILRDVGDKESPHKAVYIVGAPIVNLRPNLSHLQSPCLVFRVTPNDNSAGRYGVASTPWIVRSPDLNVVRIL